VRELIRGPGAAGEKPLATVRAWIDETSPPLYHLNAELVQNGQVKATGRGLFLDQPGLAAKAMPQGARDAGKGT
jgi:hypothetical protein